MSPIDEYHHFKIYGTDMTSKDFDYPPGRVAQNKNYLYKTIFKLLVRINMDSIKLLDMYPHLEHVDIDITIDNIAIFRKQKIIDYFQFALANRYNVANHDNFKIMCNTKLNELREMHYISNYEYDRWHL